MAMTEEVCLNADPFIDFAACQSYIQELQLQVHQLQLPKFYATYLVHNYGKDAWKIIENLRINESLPGEEALILAELDYCCTHEMVVNPLDFLVRRTGRLYFLPHSIALVERLIFPYFTEHMGWSDTQQKMEKIHWHEVVQSIRYFK
jgi:glycerol-3-phosphate dehydrogenase